jgi:hypothetical protein
MSSSMDDRSLMQSLCGSGTVMTYISLLVFSDPYNSVDSIEEPASSSVVYYRSIWNQKSEDKFIEDMSNS